LIAKTKRIAGLLIHPYHCERSGPRRPLRERRRAASCGVFAQNLDRSGFGPTWNRLTPCGGALAGEAIDGQIDVEAVRQASAAWERAQREQRTMDDFGRER
jgi:hypothetical protein